VPNDPEHNQKRTLSRRDVLKRVGLGTVALTLAACGGGTTTGGATTGPAGGAATTGPAAGATTGATGGAAATAAGGGAGTSASAAATAAGGAGGGAGAAASGGGAKPTAAPTPTTAPPAVLGKGAQKVIFWHGLGGADGKTMVKMLQQYAAQKPNITVSSQTFDWGVFNQKFPTAIAAGTPPQLAITHHYEVPQWASQGVIQDADTLFFEPGLVPKNDFNPALIEQIVSEGKTQAVPFDNHGWLNWVNTKVIKDAGLDPNNLPKNGTEFITWAKKIVVDDKGKHPDESGFNPQRVKIWAIHSSWTRYTPLTTMFQYGTAYFSDDKKKALLSDPKSIAALQYWNDLIYKHHVVPPAVPGTTSPGNLFKANAIALMWDGTWSLNFFKDNPDAGKNMQPMFINSLAPDGKQAVRFDSHMMVVPQGVEGKDLDAAKDLITWLSNNGETWATSGQVPARLSQQQKPSVQGIQSVKVAADQFGKIGHPGQGHPAINEIQTDAETAFGAILAGSTPTSKAMTDANKQVQAILDRG
jgi:ABC-type glycerol-3-phosphate transport system substrate-binding protein